MMSAIFLESFPIEHCFLGNNPLLFPNLTFSDWEYRESLVRSRSHCASHDTDRVNGSPCFLTGKELKCFS